MIKSLVFNYVIMTEIDVETFKKAGFSYEEIESVKRGLDDIENGRLIAEDEFYSRVGKKVFSNNRTYA